MSEVRNDFCTEVMRGAGGLRSPRKKGLNGTMPAVVNSRVGSPAGTSDADGMRWWPRSSKKLKYRSRISSPFMHLLAIVTT